MWSKYIYLQHNTIDKSIKLANIKKTTIDKDNHFINIISRLMNKKRQRVDNNPCTTTTTTTIYTITEQKQFQKEKSSFFAFMTNPMRKLPHALKKIV